MNNMERITPITAPTPKTGFTYVLLRGRIPKISRGGFQIKYCSKSPALREAVNCYSN